MKVTIGKNEAVTVEGDEPKPEWYCLTADSIDEPENDPDTWPIWLAELADYQNAAQHAVDTLEARYRAWRAKFEETITARGTKVPPMHVIKREVEAMTKFHTFKISIADANRLARRYEGWRNAIERRVSLHIVRK